MPSAFAQSLSSERRIRKTVTLQQLLVNERIEYLLSHIGSDQLDVLVLCETVLGSLATEAGLLNSTEGDASLRDQASVNSDHSDLEGGRDAGDTSNVLGEEVACETDLGLIGPLENLLLSGEAVEGSEGSCGGSEGQRGWSMERGEVVKEDAPKVSSSSTAQRGTSVRMVGCRGMSDQRKVGRSEAVQLTAKK